MRVALEQLRDVFDSLDYHVAVYDHAWRYTYVNAAAAQMLGRDAEELLGRSIWDLFPEAVGNQYYRELHEARETGRIIHSEHYYAPFDRWFENHIYPRGDTVAVLANEITDRKRAEEALRERDALLRLAQRAGGMATFDWDPARQEGRCSPEFFAFVGLPAPADGRMLTEHWLERVHAEDRPRLTAHLRRAAAGEEPATADYRIVRPDGTVRWLSYSGQILDDPSIGAPRLLGTVIDITERKLTEEALRDADRRKDEFIAMLAHELRNPLAPIRYAVSMLERSELTPEDAGRARAVIDRQVGHLVRLVDDLLDVSRITRGTFELRRRPVTVQEVVRAAVESCAPHLEGSSLRLHVQVPPQDLWLDADPSRMTQVVTNLLHNAIKYTPPPGEVFLVVERDGGDLALRVCDTGLGIRAADLPRVFDKFTQIAPHAAAQSGLGLGLTLVRSLVEMHGGTVTARSDGPGRGAEFVVRLAEASAPAPSSVPDAIPVGPEPAGRRVLIVDDNPDALETLNALVRSFGCTTAVARDGVEALAVAEAFDPEVVLLDIGLPALNGYEVARRLRGTGRAMTLVAITGWGQEEDRRRAAASGFDQHLTKPPDPNRIRELLAARSKPAGV